MIGFGHQACESAGKKTGLIFLEGDPQQVGRGTVIVGVHVRELHGRGFCGDGLRIVGQQETGGDDHLVALVDELLHIRLVVRRLVRFEEFGLHAQALVGNRVLHALPAGVVEAFVTQFSNVRHETDFEGRTTT